jgi:hypothetical protein
MCIGWTRSQLMRLHICEEWVLRLVFAPIHFFASLNINCVVVVRLPVNLPELTATCRVADPHSYRGWDFVASGTATGGRVTVVTNATATADANAATATDAAPNLLMGLLAVLVVRMSGAARAARPIAEEHLHRGYSC